MSQSFILSLVRECYKGRVISSHTLIMMRSDKALVGILVSYNSVFSDVFPEAACGCENERLWVKCLEEPRQLFPEM